MANYNEIIQEINTNLPDNNTQSITAKKLRDTLINTLYGTEEEYDISANNNGTKYINLTSALGTDGANVPSTVRKGGMSIRFINSDGKYEQWRYMGTSIANADFANVANWQGVDDVPVSGSDNLVKSGGISSIKCALNAGEFDSSNSLLNGRVSAFFPIGIIRKFHLELYEVIFPEGDHIRISLTDSKSIYSSNEIRYIFNLYDEQKSLDIDITDDDILNGAKYISVHFTSVESEPYVGHFKAVLYNNTDGSLLKAVRENSNKIDELSGILSDNITKIDENINANEDYTDKSINIPKVYISYTDGIAHYKSNWTLYKIENVDKKQIFSIKAILGFTDRGVAAIAFFSENVDLNVSEDTDVSEYYMGEYSIRSENSVEKEYYAEVPEGCKMIAICNRSGTLPTPSIYCKISKIGENSNSIVYSNKSLANTYYNLFSQNLCYGHLFIDKHNEETPINCQSLFDINATARLGMKYIEANVHKTQDGQWIALHGVNGAFGKEVVDLNGEYTYQNTLIEDVTYEWISQNIRYNSSIASHKTTIPTLEEFIKEAKNNKLGLMININDESVRSLVAKFYTDEDIIAYNGTSSLRESGFTGVILRYSATTTLESIMEEMDSIKAPAIFMFNTSGYRTVLNNGTLQEIVQALHTKGYLVGIASCYHTIEETLSFLDAGGDALGSSNFVNDFENGNILNLKGDYDYDDFNIVNGTVSNGKLTLTQGGTISIDGQQVYLGKGSLRIMFNGSIKITYFGHEDFTNVIINSTGNQSVWISTYYMQQYSGFSLMANTDTDIYSLNFKSSKC